jgi:Xaa-Pro aminopeptidase
MLTMEGCRRRQARMIGQLEQLQCDVFVTADVRTIYYLTGSFAGEGSPALLALEGDGRSVLITPVGEGALASDIRTVETYSIERTITQPVHDAVRLLADALGERRRRRAAVERASTPALVEQQLLGAGIVDATATVLRLRKRKEADEIEEIRRSLRLCAVAYDAARRTIVPGRTEIDVFNAMHGAITRKRARSCRCRVISRVASAVFAAAVLRPRVRSGPTIFTFSISFPRPPIMRGIRAAHSRSASRPICSAVRGSVSGRPASSLKR